MEALMKIQSDLKAPKGQRNNFGKYNYRSCEDILEAVKPLLKENDATLTLSDEIIDVCGHIFVKAIATFQCGTTATVVNGFAKHSLTKKGMDDSQITGSASSYARKYALNGLFLIDDTKDADTQKPTTIEQLPQASDLIFDKYVKWIIEEVKDKKGELITIEYLKARHTLNSAQESALQLINL
tara:strand:+ start:4274 stop:4822 length:549 start_codon:yes stop_codon:yes gene_type:complete